MNRRTLMLSVLAATAAGRGAEAAQQAPVLVELFTSQGCNSCPPADAQLARLAQRPDVLALAFHVTYWDRLGWTDTFGDKRFTERQYAYAGILGSSRVYTPQIVIAGEVDRVGSDPAVLRAIGAVREHGHAAPIAIDMSGLAELPGVPMEREARLWAAAFDDQESVEIERGENAGRTIHYRNIVRDLIDLGSWDGQPRKLRVREGWPGSVGAYGIALVAQDAATGRVHAVGALPQGTQ
jgi:hypothetical protein